MGQSQAQHLTAAGRIAVEHVEAAKDRLAEGDERKQPVAHHRRVATNFNVSVTASDTFATIGTEGMVRPKSR